MIPYEGKTQRKDIADNILMLLRCGKTVVSHCSSKKLATDIYQEAIKIGKKCKLYHGDLYDTTTIDKLEIDMKQQKEEDFKDINKALSSVDLLIYTGTLTAGVDV